MVPYFNGREECSKRHRDCKPHAVQEAISLAGFKRIQIDRNNLFMLLSKASTFSGLTYQKKNGRAIIVFKSVRCIQPPTPDRFKAGIEGEDMVYTIWSVRA